MAIIIDAKVIQAMEPEQVKEMVLRSAAFDNDADGGCPLPVKKLSTEVFDEHGERILNVLAITQDSCSTPPLAGTVKVSFQITGVYPTFRRMSALIPLHPEAIPPFIGCLPQMPLNRPRLILSTNITNILIHDRP